MGKREEKCMKTNTDLFEKVPVPKAVATMAVPTMISMLVVVIYNMADTFFVGQTGDALQVAAVSLTNPIFIFLWLLPICLVWAEVLWHPWPWEKESLRKQRIPRLYHLCQFSPRCYYSSALIYMYGSDLTYFLAQIQKLTNMPKVMFSILPGARLLSSGLQQPVL